MLGSRAGESGVHMRTQTRTFVGVTQFPAVCLGVISRSGSWGRRGYFPDHSLPQTDTCYVHTAEDQEANAYQLDWSMVI